MLKIISLLFFIGLSSTASAQVKYERSFGDWILICDDRNSSVEHCYFSLDPNKKRNNAGLLLFQFGDFRSGVPDMGIALLIDQACGLEVRVRGTHSGERFYKIPPPDAGETKCHRTAGVNMEHFLNDRTINVAFMRQGRLVTEFQLPMNGAGAMLAAARNPRLR